MTFLGWSLRLSDLQLGDEKVTLNHLVLVCVCVCFLNYHFEEWRAYLFGPMGGTKNH